MFQLGRHNQFDPVTPSLMIAQRFGDHLGRLRVAAGAHERVDVILETAGQGDVHGENVEFRAELANGFCPIRRLAGLPPSDFATTAFPAMKPPPLRLRGLGLFSALAAYTVAFIVVPLRAVEPRTVPDIG